MRRPLNGMEPHCLDVFIDSFTEPDGVRIDPALGLLVLSADELLYLALVGVAWSALWFTVRRCGVER